MSNGATGATAQDPTKTEDQTTTGAGTTPGAAGGQVDPAKGAAGSAKADDANSEESEKPWVEKLDKDQQKYIKSINKENAERRAREQEQRAEIVALKAEKSEREKKELEESGKWKDAYESLKPAQEKAKNKIIETELRAAAAAEGLFDLDAIKLNNREKIKISDDYETSGVDAAVKEFKASKPDWFKAPPAPQKPGTGSAAISPPPASGSPSNIVGDLKPGSPEYEKRMKEFSRTGK